MCINTRLTSLIAQSVDSSCHLCFYINSSQSAWPSKFRDLHRGAFTAWFSGQDLLRLHEGLITGVCRWNSGGHIWQAGTTQNNSFQPVLWIQEGKSELSGRDLHWFSWHCCYSEKTLRLCWTWSRTIPESPLMRYQKFLVLNFFAPNSILHKLLGVAEAM